MAWTKAWENMVRSLLFIVVPSNPLIGGTHRLGSLRAHLSAGGRTPPTAGELLDQVGAGIKGEAIEGTHSMVNLQLQIRFSELRSDRTHRKSNEFWVFDSLLIRKS
ncbi:MAG TPA: hypothetical protein VLS27_09270 [Gammaproteobacteria bacterium]|nr:hypothetical protein [Gammaproteobacteria bacterium]